MGARNFNIIYKSSIEDIVEVNSSFDRGVLRVAYTGKNRNKSFISKNTFEECVKTIYNCPIVCNYNRETDSIGSHDIDIVNSQDGIRLVNITQPVGVVPESANYWWEMVEEDNGDVHEYLCVDIIIWKRQEAYSKIKNNKITDESMEIKVKSGKTVDGYYHIDSFEFTAFCLLESAEPCYESACIEMFSLGEFKGQYSKMLSELKQYSLSVNTSTEDDIDPQNITQNLSKGGDVSLNKIKLLKKYGLEISELDFDINDFTVEELEEKFKALRSAKFEGEEELGGGTTEGGTEGEASGETETEPEEDAGETDAGDGTDTEGTGDGEQSEDTDDDEDETGNKRSKKSNKKHDNNFSISGEQFRDQLIESLSVEKYTDPCWGNMCKYMYVDYDAELSEVYCYDCENWKLYGFTYSMNGDNVVIDFGCKKKKKFSIVDFDEGSNDCSYKYAFESYGKAILFAKNSEIELYKSEQNQKLGEMQSEIDELKKYKRERTDAERKEAEEELFKQFAELDGIETFENLKSNCSDMTLESIENRCYEIKGRNAFNMNFNVNKPKTARVVIENNKVDDEPYGGLFAKYLPKNN